MSAVAIAPALDIIAEHATAADVITSVSEKPLAAKTEEVLSAHAAVVQATKNGDDVDKNALNTLVGTISECTATQVSRDTVLAHTVLLNAFHTQLRDNTNEAKDLALLCTAESRYLSFMNALAGAVATDKSLVQNPPLPPLDVAMFWHSHMLSPIRYADDVQRQYGPLLVEIEFPLMRLVMAAMGANQADLDAGAAFWMAHMPSDLPYSLTPSDIDESAVTGTVHCPSCTIEHTLTMAEYAPFRLHGKPVACASCTTEFTAEHVAVRRFLTFVRRAPTAQLAGALIHPKTGTPAPKVRGIHADHATLFESATWAMHVASLPSALATWADVNARIFKPIMAARADALVLPGSKARFALIQRAHADVLHGPWSMDMVRAVRRQRRFSAKVATLVSEGGAAAVYHLHTEALAQYPKFLAAMVARSGSGASFVPTIAIDLAWHTHQLFPRTYRAHTRALTGMVVNHDDSDDAERALKMALFDEDYLSPTLPCAEGAKFPMSSDAARVLAGCSMMDMDHAAACKFAADAHELSGAVASCGGCSFFCRYGACLPYIPRSVQTNQASCGGCSFFCRYGACQFWSAP